MIIRRDELACYSPLLSQRHGVVSEYPVIAGTGISVHNLGRLHEMEGYSAARLVIEYECPPVTLEAVHAALACFAANRALFQLRAEEDEREFERDLDLLRAGQLV